MPLHRAALRVHHGYAQLVAAVGFQEIGPDVFDAHVGLVGREGEGLGGEALVSALFVHGGDHEGFQHAGRLGGLGKAQLHAGRSVAVQPGVKQVALGFLELRGGVVEAIVLELREGRALHAAEGEPGVGPGTAGRSAGEPLGANPGLGGLAGFQHLRIIGTDFKPIGFDGLYVQRLLEAAAAGLEPGVPVAGGVIGLGGNVKAEKAVGAFLHQSGVEAAFRGIDLQGYRMSGGEVPALVIQQQVHVQGVAGPPDAALSVNEGLEAVFHLFPAHVKAAQGALGAVGGFEVGGAAAGLGHQHEGLPLRRKVRQALAVRLALANALQLVVVHFHLGPGKRPAGNEVGGAYPEVRAVGISGHQADVGGHQLHRREAVAVHVEGGFGGVVGLLVIVVFPVVVVVPPVRAGLVPGGFVGPGRSAGGGCGVQQGLSAAVEGLVLPEAQAHAVNGAGLLPEEPAQVYAVGVPLAEVLGRVQLHVCAVNQAAAPAQGVAARAQIVVLQVGEDVFLINLDHAHLYAAQVDGAEGEEEVVFGGQDGALEGNFHGGHLLICHKAVREGLPEGLAVRALETAVQGEHQVGLATLVVHAQQAVLHLSVAAGGSFQFHHALEGGVGGGLAQHYIHAPVLERQLFNPEGAAAVRHQNGAAFRAPLRHNRVDEGGGIGPKLLQVEAYVVGFAGFQGAGFGQEAHAGRAVPADGALDGRFGGEEAGGIYAALHLLHQVYAELGILGHHAAGVGFDIGGEFLGRRCFGLFGGPPAGGKNGRRGGHQKQVFTHSCKLLFHL